jgi:phosphatidylinositol 3-kinase
VFVTQDVIEYPIIFKAGEDIRRDYIIISILGFVDAIWKKEDLDLALTTYKCLPLSLNDGIIEFVPSEPISNIIERSDGNLATYFYGETSCSHDAKMENFVRSSAGYSVFTYVLGIGDRHLDNILLKKDGKIFHIDFAYIFGQDPKPFPPPMKICKEMVEAMGGPTGIDFQSFKKYCFEALKILRRYSRLLNSFIYASVEDSLRELSVKYVSEKLMLLLDEAKAIKSFEKLIDDSINALFPILMETLHKWAQYWRE